ncbi:MAG: efflux transporter outer membrane subunit [Polyangia bacterium]|jgi:multidrug efflux system outer membrane protein
MTKSIVPGAVLVLLSGCNFTPAYTRPAAPVPGAWGGSDGPTKADAPRAANLGWQEYFTNPGLRDTIGLALANNRDVRVAALNVEKTGAAYGIERAGLYPTLGVSASGQQYRLPSSMAKLGGPMTVKEDTITFGVLSWELDFFGRIRSLSEQARQQYLASEQARVAAQLALVASVAQQYLAYAADSEALQIAQSTVATQKAYAELVAKSYQLGIDSELAFRQAQSQVEAARADVARFRGLVAADQNALDLLVGMSVPARILPRDLDSAGELRDVSAGLSSEVLLGRPDILAAEYQLKAANANIGAARAAFFPSVSLTGGIGTMSPQLSQLFGAGTGTWSFTPQITVPLFAGGALRAGLRVSEISRDIAVAQYETAIQSAFREVSDGLVRRAALADQLEAQRALLDSLNAAFSLSELRYEQGLDGYLNVLVAQQSLYGARQGIVATRLARQSNQVTLFKALGGRW